MTTAVNGASTFRGNNRNDDEFINVMQYLVILKSRWLMIIGFTFISVLLAILVVFAIKPTYQATAVLLIEAEQRKAVSIDDVIGIDTSKQEYYLTQFELLKSRSIAQRVIDEFKLYDNPEFNGENDGKGLSLGGVKAILQSVPLIQSFMPVDELPNLEQQQEIARQKVMKTFRDNLHINPVKKTQLVNISFDSQDPKLAAKIANAVGETYINSNRESRIIANQEATNWLADRIGVLQAAVIQSQGRLSEFLQREQLVDVSGIDSLASSELGNLSRRLADAQDRRTASESIYYLLQDNKNTAISELSSVTAISNHPQLRDIRLAQIEAERLVSELSKRYGPKHDKMIRAQAQLASVKNRSEVLLRVLASGVEKELRSARSQENAIRSEMENKKAEFQDIALKRATYNALKREVDSNQNLYDLFVTRQKETSATSDFQAAVARFADRAVTPLFPAKPKKGIIILLASVMGMMLAIVLALLGQSLNNTIESASGIEDKLRLTPLGVIPLVKGSRFNKDTLPLEQFFDEKQINFSEAVRSIRTSVMLSMMSQQRKLLSITSSVPNEGKTTTALNLAVAMAGMEKTLLIDCDLRKPSLGERFNLNRAHPGLSNLLVMEAELDDCIVHHERSGLDLLPAGMQTANPQELLAGAKFKALIDDLSQHYDKIIIDTPPIAAVSDALIVGQVTKSSIVVVNAGRTKVSQIEHTLSQLISHNVVVDGVILNRVNPKHETRYGYYREYGTTA
ncbi:MULTISPECIES: GumC family protein [unclassified Agarivorans]|uniref:GumC family protein n=1 Tax=unclassified Agarivorans TaxID=2636026 RepID=UPI0026E33245|nr:MULTISPECIES: polysaccharide biosynthesis tyrosine autokinase [unclassified Agarivorans]MDO6686111.1 polysaccharide biosynthesis tyrosine autokinase [Agarivorans sp. 3_MG-2023]MDO6716440.1 polysaccharide biosynthesis tyrosine autokinase [Agarivorans sp. 2_MG-2023]